MNVESRTKYTLTLTQEEVDRLVREANTIGTENERRGWSNLYDRFPTLAALYETLLPKVTL